MYVRACASMPIQRGRDFCYHVSVAANAPHDPSPPAVGRSHREHPSFARFRAWRERAMPIASYRIAPAFWTPAGLLYRATFDPIVWPVIKRREPTITGLAYTPRALYLVVVARSPSYEHAAKLIHCRALARDDADYAEHRGKRVKLLVVCDDCPPAVADFARRYHVRVIAQGAQTPAQIGTRTGISFCAPISADAVNVLKCFST